MITSNVYHRVFFIKAAQYGTAFTMDVDGRQYLVTAKHLLGGEQPSTIQILHNKIWKPLQVALVGATNDDGDAAVFAPATPLSPPLPLEVLGGDNQITLGQDVFFLGYPYKMWTDGGAALGYFPCPFIKKGTLASSLLDSDGELRLYIDALNNPGFSGGPIVFKPMEKGEFHLAGMVSRFLTQKELVIGSEGEETDYEVSYNTGFLIGTPIARIKLLIDANPIGLDVRTKPKDMGFYPFDWG